MSDPSQLTLPDPPTGPQSEVPRKAENRYPAYRKWRLTKDGGQVFGYMLARARALLDGGATRISAKGLTEAARSTLRRDINNSYTAFLADELCACCPELVHRIERRKRRAKP